MKNIILLTAVVLSLVAVLITYSKRSAEDELAYRMSKSSSFLAIVNYGKQLAGKVKSLPDSTRNNIRGLGPLANFINNKILSPAQKRDSLIRLTNFLRNEKWYDSSFYKETINMGSAYKQFFKDFPEYKKMPIEEKRIVFKKAFNLSSNNK